LGVWGVPPDGVRFDPSGKWLLAALGLLRGLLVANTHTGEGRQLGTLDVNCVAVSRTGQVLAGSGRIVSFGITAGGPGRRTWAKALNGSRVAGVDFYPGGEQFSTVESKYSARAETGLVTRVRAAGDGRVNEEVEPDCKEGGILRVSPDGAWIAFGEKRFLILHRGVQVTRSERVPNPGKKPITGLAFHPSGRYLAATGGDATVRFHDRDAGWAVARTFDWGIGVLKSVAFHPEGTVAAAVGEKGQVVVWDVDR
jgi:WD40 repeat protein